MMSIEIYCKGIKNLSAFGSGDICVTLEDVSADFIEQLETRDIIMWADNKKLLEAMDQDAIFDYIENRYDIKMDGVRY